MAFTALAAGPASAQRMIEGRVTIDSITPLAGVTVEVKGSTISTLTDQDGKYTIAAGDLATLVFRRTGYTTTEEFVNGRVVIDVIMLRASPVNIALGNSDDGRVWRFRCCLKSMSSLFFV